MSDQDKTVDYISSGDESPKITAGIYTAEVISHLDPDFMGDLEVRLNRQTGNSNEAGQLVKVKYMSSFWGQTSVAHIGEDPDDYNNTQKSYGMWMVPPDIGATVIVLFPMGNPKVGYWVGVIPDEKMNFMVPGLAATKYVVDGDGSRVPVAEYNKKIGKSNDATKILKPKHPFAEVLDAQGLLKDDTRGITTSSARREVPSAVFGISTPGPVDKRSGAKKGKVGKDGNQVNAFVSRFGGTTFVMDDGDDKFLRKTKASDGPPEYAAVEQGETDGDPTIPHNELVRIRTRTGHQILLHNSEDLIYIGNARGTTWIELTSNGKIDIYAADDISMHTGGNFNVTAGGNINLTSGGNVNINSGGTLEVQNGGTNIDGGEIHLNSGTANAPVAPRVPDVEPWAGHENLHGSPLKYSTATDTFEQIKPSEK